MSKRFWLLGVGVLVSIGVLLACGSNYNRSQDGLLLVGSQGSSLIETFSFTLSNGHVSAIANSPSDTGNQTCVLNGSPSNMVIDPKGAYAYVIFNKSTQCPNATQFGIATFSVGSDGNVKQVGGLTADTNPVTLAMDSAGKFLFVAEGASGLVHSYAIGSGGSLSAVAGSFTFINGTGFQTPNIVAIAPSPTVFPGIGLNGTQNSVCSVPQNIPPTAEFLYAADSVNNVVWEFAVNTSSGALGNPPGRTSVAYFAADQVPAGVAVDPCDRFVYVSNSQSNKVNGYLICATVQLPTPCPFADGSLVPVAGSPFSLSGNANGAGPIVVDPYGNNVYVVGALSNTVSPLKISPISGALTAMSPPVVVTGDHAMQPGAIVIRPDDNWMFVSNFNAATVSQFSITPATGQLSAAAPIPTDNYPWGLAVK